MPPTLYHNVMSSGEEAWQYLARRDDPFYTTLGRRCLHIGSERDTGIRAGLGLELVAAAEEAEFILNTGPAGWDDQIEDYAPLLRRALARGLPMVCANPDLVVMHGGRLALCAGALAQWYEESGGRVRWHGKPFPSVYDACLDLLGMDDRSRILAVGDSLRTDIAGAAGAGIDSVLIIGGIHADELALAAGITRPRANRECATRGLLQPGRCWPQLFLVAAERSVTAEMKSHLAARYRNRCQEKSKPRGPQSNGRDLCAQARATRHDCGARSRYATQRCLADVKMVPMRDR